MKINNINKDKFLQVILFLSKCHAANILLNKTKKHHNLKRKKHTRWNIQRKLDLCV